MNMLRNKWSIFALILLGTAVANILKALIQPAPDFEYGFPFVVYEYVDILNRGRFSWAGLAGDIIFPLLLGFAVVFLFGKLHSSDKYE